MRDVIRTIEDPSLFAKVVLALRALYWFGVVHAELRRHPVPLIVERLRAVDRVRPYRIPAGRLGRGVAHLLKIGPLEARCLVMALVHFRLLREQGDEPELVIGLERISRTRDAHAWLEIDGRDVGPPPGRGAHEGLLRYR
jgi:hypothetical protein